MTSRNLAWCVAGILLLLCVQPALASPDTVSYEEFVTLIHDQDGQGGCIGQSVNHVMEILKEMEAPYTPDPSYAFHWYVFYSATAGGTDPRVPPNANMGSYVIMPQYGAAPETSYPTNFDVIGTNMSHLFAHPPSDTAFQEAQAYRFEPGVAYLGNPTIAQAEDWLDTKGPLICNGLFENHTVALIGYNRSAGVAGEFTIVDSANWADVWHAGVKQVSYPYFAYMGPYMSLEAVTNRGTPLIHPYTARIRISSDYRRSNLAVRIGVAGHEYLTVWDRNNQANFTDRGTDLAIDVPLPAYAAEHWPPSEQNTWSVQVTNYNQAFNATLKEVTLVKRIEHPSPLPVTADVYAQKGLPIVIPPGMKYISFPKSVTVTSPVYSPTWTAGEKRTITWTQNGLDDTNVRIELRRGAAGTLVETIAASAPARTGFQSGSYEWQVSTDLEPGSDYFVRVESLVDPLISDRSEGLLTIQSPEAGFWCAPKAGYAPLTVYFHDTSDGPPSSWFWNFGDGTVSTIRSPTHTYAAAGTYTVSLTAYYPDGGSRSVTKTAEVAVGSLTDGLVRVEAEDYNEGGEGVGYHDTTPGNSGGAYRPDDVDIVQGRTFRVVTDLAAGEWTRYQVVSGAAGMHDYPLQLRVASYPAKPIPQTITVNVSGVEGVVEVGLPNTGSNASYAFANATLRLRSGLNTVQFTYHGDETNFDYFTLDPSGVAPWPTITPPPPHIEVYVVPGAIGPPTSTSIPGLFDDVNGNSRKDFADVVLYFNQLSWIGMNEPVEGFDYNSNLRVDFADVVWLFNHL